ncbi:UBX domain-containing protein 11 isoform X2 [Pimephales promelas]|uniref:UBX domain-containing protein 11 isoform X2 n=1 Tax=Pimephales promelas TaxID=90988 RepID=UPI0019559C5E|nr:UBX domain-containing protein 11 isoform X2 [Pimephales promelas]
MSSPLSTLRKNKRAPLPEIQSDDDDGERKLYKERSDTDYEAKLFRNIFPQNKPVPHIMDNLSTVRSKVTQKKKAKEAPPSDFELMSSMMQKISQLERKVKTQTVDIEQKARRIAVLEEKLNLLQKAKEKSARNENQDEELVQLCLKLQNQVLEMEECMQDLMDGFFPSELQERFPNGVPLQVNDKRDEEFVVRRPWTEFPGKGQTIEGARGQSVVRSEQTISTAPKQSQIPGKKLSMEQFLQKLPETVVKAGKVISIRDSVKAHLQGFPDGAKSYSATTVETSALRALREREIDFPPSSKDVTTLRVKSEDGMETFIMKMYSTETFGDLRHYLDLKRGPGAAPFDIISAFPQRCYSDDTQTLLSCGLTPNAALLLRPQAASHRQNNV